jgi:hypothetical protein
VSIQIGTGNILTLLVPRSASSSLRPDATARSIELTKSYLGVLNAKVIPADSVYLLQIASADRIGSDRSRYANKYSLATDIRSWSSDRAVRKLKKERYAIMLPAYTRMHVRTLSTFLYINIHTHSIYNISIMTISVKRDNAIFLSRDLASCTYRILELDIPE